MLIKFLMRLYSSMQTNLFEQTDLNLPDADIKFYKNFIAFPQTEVISSILEYEIKWKQNKLKIYGKEVLSPRLTAWYGDKTYTYSGITNIPNAWTNTLLKLKALVEHKASCEFNSVLLGLYRDGNDSIAWHSDDEKELGKNPIIASLSFGAERTFHLKHKSRDVKTTIKLTDGSLLVMAGGTQENYLHQIPKEVGIKMARINLTFRNIK